MKFMDLDYQLTSIDKEVFPKIREIISNNAFIGGSEIKMFEKEFDKIGNLIKKTVYENSKVMLTEEYKFEYYS